MEINKEIVNSQIDTIYRENFFSLKIICQHIKIWDNYSDEEKFDIENVTRRDSLINGHFKYDKTYDKSLTYGEISKLGGSILYDFIKKNKDITDKDIFVDLGSGLGKLVLQLGAISEFKTLLGIEISDIRYQYSKYLQEKVGILNKDIFFLNKDIKDFDLSILTVVFCDNVTWDIEFCNSIWERLQKGCHYITYKKVEKFSHHEVINLPTTWVVPQKGDFKKFETVEFNYYIK